MTNALNNDAGLLRRPQVCEPQPRPRPKPNVGDHDLRLDVTPEQIPENGDATFIAQATDFGRPEGELIATLFTVSTGTIDPINFLANGIPTIGNWRNLTGPPGIECVLLTATWHDSTQSSVQDCIDYTS